MPKMKTKSGVKKRFKITGTGILLPFVSDLARERQSLQLKSCCLPSLSWEKL